MEAGLPSGCPSGKLAAHCGKDEPGVLRTGLYAVGHPRWERAVGSLGFSSASGFLFVQLHPSSLKLRNEEERQREKRKTP